MLLPWGGQGDEGASVCVWGAGPGQRVTGQGSRAIREHMQTPKKAKEPSASHSTSFQPKVFCDSVTICLSCASVQSSIAVYCSDNILLTGTLLWEVIAYFQFRHTQDIAHLQPQCRNSLSGRKSDHPSDCIATHPPSLQNTNSCPYSFGGF